tara:strand:+ start:136 stop:744 length:609 start_codon:yes stop_codon:yes gene_type:complete
LEKNEILKKYSLTKRHEVFFEQYILGLKNYNLHTNLVGKSTLINPWKSHILDCLQIVQYIENKSLSIVDIGSGAGFPGHILSIVGYKNITLVDSNGKKIKFLNKMKNEMSLNSKIILGRVEELKNIKYDIITSRALASLTKLFSYSQKILKKNTVLILLKGKTVNDEIRDAKKKWTFNYTKKQSISDIRGQVLIIKNIEKND